MGVAASQFLAARHIRVRRLLDALSLDAVVVTAAANIRYLSNHAGTAGILVLTRDAAHLLVDFRYRESVRLLQDSPSACPGLRVWDVPASYNEALLTCLAEIGVSTVGFEAAHVTVATHEWWRQALEARHSDVALRATDRVVEQARLIKDAAEIATMRDAARRLTPVAAAVFESVRAGRSEQQVAAVLESRLRAVGYERPAFDTIVASGPHSASRTTVQGNEFLRKGTWSCWTSAASWTDTAWT